MITFTIVIVTYNAAQVLQRTLDSVLAQTYPHVEHLIIDGASSDGSVAMAQAYRASSDERSDGHNVFVVSEPDSGLYDAMNKGLHRATGDYVCFLNAGDVFPAADTLETIANSVGDGENLPGVLYGDTDIVDDNGRFLRHRRLSPPARLTWRSFLHGMVVCHQAFYARTSIARHTPYNTAYRYSADVDWCIRIMREATRQKLALKPVHAVVVNYLDGGMTVRNHRASLQERFRVMKSHYGLLPTVAMHLWFILRSAIRK